MPLDEELAFYNEIRDDLVATALNQWVVIKDNELLGVFSTDSEALDAGAAAYGAEEFLVKQVRDPEPVENL